MKTRRASKKAATGEHLEGTSVANTEVAFHVTIPDDLAEDALEALCPDITLTSPTPEAIVELYRFILDQASLLNGARKELEENRAELVRKDVELDQALQDRDVATEELETSTTKVTEEMALVKQQRDELSEEKTKLKNLVASLTQSQSSTNTDVDSFRARVEQVEREKRDLLGAVQRLQEDAVQHEEETTSLRAQLKEERTKALDKEAALAETRSTQVTNDYKIQVLDQQLALARSETERYSRDLTSKTNEFSQYRREKHTEVAELQSTVDSLTQTNSATETTLHGLQKSYTEQSHQLNQVMQKLNSTKSQLADQAASFRSESATQTRVVALLERRDEEMKQRIQDVEREWERMVSQADDREARFRNELERERDRGDALERKLEEMKVVIEKIGTGELPVPGQDGDRSSPGTPGLNTSNRSMTVLSPTASMAGKFQKTGKTYTEVYADYVRMQDELSKQKQETRRLEECLAQVCAEIEDRAPLLQEQRAEYDRMSVEVTQLAAHLAQAMQERDSQEEIARKSTQEAQTSQKENDLLQKQLSDLGLQVRYLMRDIAHRDNPALPVEDEDDAAQPNVPDLTDTDNLITSELVLFKTLPELQAQNQKLLRIARELSTRMESEEREYMDSVKDLESRAISEAHDIITKLRDEVESQKLKMETYIRERDMFRKMMTHGGKGAEINGFGGAGRSGGPDYERLYTELQANFDAYRVEMGTDAAQLKEDLFSARREVNHLSASLAKSDATLELYTERLRMASDSSDRQATEIQNLTKRNQQMQQNLMQAEIASHHAMEQASEANSTAERLRNEAATLRAEKGLWNTVEARLAAENKTLSQESARLTSLVQNLQRVQGDLERAGDSERQRLRSQIRSLEDQSADMRNQLNQERESVRHIRLQKDIESKELHSRIDRATTELSTTRESLVAAEINQKHTQTRADDLSKQLQVIQEKVSVYERRPSLVNGHPSALSNADDATISREQLQAELAELSAALKSAQVDLEHAKINAAQYQSISQGAESALAEMNSTYDEYKRVTDGQISSKEGELKVLQNKLHTIHEQLTTSSNENSALHRQLEADRIKYENEIQLLKDTVVDMTTASTHVQEEEFSFKQQLKRESENTKEAQSRYEREVMAHGQAIQTVTELRSRLSGLETRLRDSEHEVEKAKATVNLQTGQSETQKQILEREVNDLRERIKSLMGQNAILHDQLQAITSQASRIRELADSSASMASDSGSQDAQAADLRSLISYLRNEKDIIEMQLDLQKQENTRMKTELEYVTANLDENRIRLAEERERAANSAASASEHAELMEKINQLNILRESNATLRSESEAHSKRARQLETDFRKLSTELDPVKEEARLARAELEARAQVIKHLEEDNERWKNRNQQILSRYERIDPAELQALKEEVDKFKVLNTTLVSEKEQAEAALANQKKLVETYKANLVKWRADHTELSSTSKAKFSEFTTTISQLSAERDTLRSERDKALASQSTADAQSQKVAALTRQIEVISNEKNTMKNTFEEEKRALEARLAEKTAPQDASEAPAGDTETILALRAERDALLAEKQTWTSASVAESVAGPTVAWEAEKGALVKQIEEFQENEKRLTARNEQLLGHNKKFFADIKKLKLEVQKAAEVPQAAAPSADVEQLVSQRLTKITASHASEKEAAINAAVTAATDKLRAELAATSQSTSSSDLNDAMARHAAELTALETRLSQKYATDLKTAVDSAVASIKQESQTPEGVNMAEQIEKAVQDRLAESMKDAVPRAQHDHEVQVALENGRKEVHARMILKDNQAVKQALRLKELEAKITELQANSVSTNSVSVPVVAAVASTSTLPVKPAPSITPSAITPKPLPTGPANDVFRGRGRGRGIRAAAGRVGTGRGAASAVLASVDSAAPSAGLSIIGAASGKRGREDSEPTGPLSKRLRGTDANAT